MEEPIVDNEKIEENGESEENGEINEEIIPEITPELTPEIEVEPCRLCDEVGEKMFNIFDDNPEGYQLIGLIKENLPIVLYKTDPLSKQICEKCVLNLQIISSLKKRSRKTQDLYVDKLKKDGDTDDKNVLLFLGCTGSKLVDNGDEDEDDEEELQDKGTSTDDLTILCANCKTAILDASTVNGDVELSEDLHKAIAESLRRNRVMTGDADSEKVLRRRKIQPIYQELDDSLCSSMTDLTRNTAGDDDSQYGEGDAVSDLESEDSNEERPAKRRKLERCTKRIQEEIDEEIARNKDNSSDENDSENAENGQPEEEEEEEEDSQSSEKVRKTIDKEQENEPEEIEDKDDGEDMEIDKELEEKQAEAKKIDWEAIFDDEPDFTVEPLSLLQIALNSINTQNVPDYEPQHYIITPTVCNCKTCGKDFKNVKLLALHEPEHMDVDLEEKIDNPEPWPGTHLHAKVRNRWLTYFDENGYDEDDIIVDIVGKEDSSLLVENTEKTMDMSKKDEVILVNMKPMVNGIYLGDYTKEERKAFYQCMRIGGQTKRFCPLCRYCFKDNWAIESHYFSLACHYTCRYCGMRFNKQRHRFDEHTKEHKKKSDPVSDKIFTASKVNNTLPKVIQPDKVKRVVPGEPEKPREIRLEDYASPPVITKGGFDQRNRYSNTPQQQHPQQFNFQNIKIKEEPKDFVSSQSKTQNQAYFCRKCYKVFFKLDEFNAHSKNCDYNNYPQSYRPIVPKTPTINIKKEPGTPTSGERRYNGDMSNAGRPVRNCVRDIGPYKDEVYIPKQLLNETVPGPPQSFICHICGTPFPTIYSRNSHMRIHKGETQGSPNNRNHSPHMMVQQNILKQRLQQQQQHNFQLQRAALQQQQLHLKQKHMLQQQKQHQQQIQQRHHQQTNYPQFEEVRIKEEPMDFEPMVEIHEGHEQPPSPPPTYKSPPIVPREIGGGAVSLTPIIKKPALNPNILKLVENNPNISLVSKKSMEKPNGESSSRSYGGNIKNAGGYQGPYAPSNQSSQSNNYSNGNQPYLTVSPNLMPNNDDNKSYKCSSCWEAFSNKSHLYFHKKNQCEGSRFPCPFCKKRFGTEAAYSSHIFYSHPE